MRFNNTLSLAKISRGNRLYIKNHILERMGIETDDQFEVWVDLDRQEILLRPCDNKRR